MDIVIPAFGETQYGDVMSNRNTRVVNISGVKASLLEKYCALLEANGCIQKEIYQEGNHSYAAYAQGNKGYFLNYYGGLEELNIAIEENCGYFTFDAGSGEAVVEPQITQVYLVDFGMSYVIRISDGRFIVIDGGWGFEPDVDELLRVLKAGAPDGKPVVAAWFLTHPHRDHYLGFAEFIARYPNEAEIQKVMMNFPEPDNLQRYPGMAKEDRRVENTAAVNRVPQMIRRIHALGIPVYEPHTGQRYQIGDASCQILSCLDDTILIPETDLNPASLVVRMELGGQVILWTADTAFSASRLSERYGHYLKADILQVPHHGFQSGTAEGEIAGYELVKPRVCLLPAADYLAYTGYCIHKQGTNYLMTKLGIDELIAGDATRTLTLPYIPADYKKAELAQKVLSGLDNCGACTWIFTDLHTTDSEDFVFSFLNTAYVTAEVNIDLYFDEPGRQLSCIKATLPAKSFQKLCIIDGNDVLTNTAYFNFNRLDIKGIPENATFAVRFISNLPVVISHPKHKAAYSSVNR